MDAMNESGVDLQPTPTNVDSKYADYVALNEDKSTEGKVDAPVEKVTVSNEDVKPSDSSTDKPTKEHIPDWQRRINTLTRKNKSYESEMEALRREIQSLKQPKVEQPKLTRDNFLTDDEWIDYKAELKARDVINKQMSEASQMRAERDSQYAQEQGFKQNWNQKVASNFADDQEGLSQLNELLHDAEDNMHQDIHDYIEDSPIGPRMLHVLLLRPDLVERYNQMKSVTRGVALARLEDEIMGVLNGRTPVGAQPSKPTASVSKAPAPIGQVGTSGSSRDSLSDDEAIALYRKNKYKR